MGTVIMDMSSYAVELVYPDEIEYDSEYVDSDLIPALGQQELYDERNVDMPSSMVHTDVEEFLKRMYESQR
jgi:hypothetical protein